jgi:predicted ATPase
MIKVLKIRNFKCFRQSNSFEFSKINLLTGINGRGKSSLLQAILVLAQSALKDPDLKSLIINDDLVTLGNFDDIKNSETPRGENIHFDFKFDSDLIQQAKIQFAEKLDKPLLAECVNVETVTNGKVSVHNIREIGSSFFVETFSNLIKNIHFVSADRLGPVRYVDKTNLPTFVRVGPRGEHTINILANSRDLETVNDELYIGNDANSVLQQTIEWLSYILEGAKIDIKGQEKESSVLYMLLNNRSNSYFYKPTNVGFGYSYVLPLIVTGLIAKKDQIIIIENPEAHLHPRAQSRISEFFAKVASCGVQVFIESHSEHILNGLRISSLKPEIKISYDELAIHYFDESFNAEKLLMDDKGRISNWTSGFFDQQEIDLSNLFKLSR